MMFVWTAVTSVGSSVVRRTPFGGLPVEVGRFCYGGSRKRMAMAELVHSREGCARRLAMQSAFFDYADGSGGGAEYSATVEFMTRLTACRIRQAALQAASAVESLRTFWFLISSTSPTKRTIPTAPRQNVCYRLSRLLYRLRKPARWQCRQAKRRVDLHSLRRKQQG